MKWLLVVACVVVLVLSAATVHGLLDHPGSWQCSGGCTDQEAAFSNLQKEYRRDTGLLAAMIVMLTVLQVGTVGYLLARPSAA